MNWHTFLGFSPFGIVVEGDVFPSVESLLGLSTEFKWFPLSPAPVAVLDKLEDATFTEEVFLRAGFPG